MRVMTVLILGLLAAPAAAKTSCVFTRECLEAEACADAAFEMRFEAPGAGGATRLQSGLVAETDFGELPGYAIRQGADSKSYVFEGDGTTYLLTVSGRDARLAAHVADGPLMINYIGNCLGGG